ncbi:MAG: PHB depolymerase family esterase [Polyangiaceae bacterium]
MRASRDAAVFGGLFLGLAVLAACGDDTSASGAGGGGGQGGAGGEGGGPNLDFQAGGDRPVTVHVPPGYDPTTPAPLVVLLHGYGASGDLEDVYLDVSTAARDRGVVFAAPTGTPDLVGRAFWNATDACCNFDGLDVDDEGYLMGLVDEIAMTVEIDPKRVYFIGHSNGAFMSHRLACNHADRIAGIVTLAGALSTDLTACEPSEPVSVLHVHGTADDTILFDGGVLDMSGIAYPGAEATIERWAEVDGCDPTPTSLEPIDLDFGIDGAETTVTEWGNCGSDTAVELWAIQGGGHIPILGDFGGARFLDWLLTHPK